MAGFSNYKTETIGISAEIAIADSFDVPVNDSYRTRGNSDAIEATSKIIKEVFEKYSIPPPVKHVAEGQNPVDFNLESGETLSVKTNQKALGKIAPQRVGQVTSQSYFNYFSDFYNLIPQGYYERCKVFKQSIFKYIDKFMKIYWDNLFDCDYYIHFFEYLDENNNLKTPKFLVLNKITAPAFDIKNFSFTKNEDNWNESNTVKYCGVTIGEFQIHTNRDNFKFRFNMKGINDLLKRGVIQAN